MIPGSVHWVRFRKRMVIIIEARKRRGTGGEMSQIGLNMKMK